MSAGAITSSQRGSLRGGISGFQDLNRRVVHCFHWRPGSNLNGLRPRQTLRLRVSRGPTPFGGKQTHLGLTIQGPLLISSFYFAYFPWLGQSSVAFTTAVFRSLGICGKNEEVVPRNGHDCKQTRSA